MNNTSNESYRFSIITAVYNAELYLEEAIESILCQDIGFENFVELILIDDGSTDGSGAICDAYMKKFPCNIKVIHQKNGGASAARNAGIPLATGKYVNFMDSDDKLSNNTLSEVYRYFSRVDQEVDFVSVPIYFFEKKEIPHRLNYKYDSRYNLIIDLWKQYSYVQMHASSAFFKREVLTPNFFDTSLRYAEDAKAIMELLLKKARYGIVPGGRYFYRFRNSMDSALNESKQHREWYLDCLKNYILWAAKSAEKELGFIPRFVQYTMMYDLQSRFRMEEFPENVLTPEEKEEFGNLLKQALSYIDDSIILEQKNLSKEQKDFIISMKKNPGSGIFEYFNEDARIRYGGTVTFSLSSYVLKLQAVDFYDEKIVFHGSAKLNCKFPEPSEIYARLSSGDKTEIIACSIQKNPEKVFSSMSTKLAQFTDFQVSVPRQSIKGSTKLEFCITCDSHTIRFRNLTADKSFPVPDDQNEIYLPQQHLILRKNQQNLILEQVGLKKHLKLQCCHYRKKIRESLLPMGRSTR